MDRGNVAVMLDLNHNFHGARTSVGQDVALTYARELSACNFNSTTNQNYRNLEVQLRHCPD